MNTTLFAVLSASSLIAASASTLLKGQTQAPHTFEVASIKPHPISGVLIKPWTPNFQCDPKLHCGVVGSRFREISVSLAELIVDAYKIKKFQIVGLPGWGDSGHDMYDVEAKIADDVAPTPDEARIMLRTLLADRFQLRVHHESRVFEVYALVVSKKGLKLIPNQKACFFVRPGAGRGIPAAKRRSEGSGASDNSSESLFPWAFYAQALSIFTDRPVLDESGLAGANYCTSEGQDPFAAIMVEGGNERPKDGWVYPVVEEKWGMKLEPKKAQLDVLVVDGVERPSGN